MNRATIRSEARRQSGEPSSGGRWSDSDWNSAIERAQENFARRTKCLKTYASFTTSADKAIYDISEDSLSNMLKITEVRYYTDTNTYYKLKSVSRDHLEMLQNYIGGIDGTPVAYCYEDRTIEFDCDPEADKTVRVYYYYTPTALSEDSSVPDIPVKFHDALVHYTCWKFKEADDLDFEGAIYFKNLYEEAVLEAKDILEPAAETYDYIRDEISESDQYV